MADDLFQLVRKHAANGKHANKLKDAIEETFGGMSRKERERLLMAAAIPDGWEPMPVGWLIRFLLHQKVSADTRTDVHFTYPTPSGVPLLHALASDFQRAESSASRSPAKIKAQNRRVEDAAIAFVDAGANIGPHAKLFQRTPLHFAAEHGAMALVRALLRRKANVNAVDKVGETPLFYAARGDSVAVLKLLVEAGAKNARNRKGETAHDIAIAHGSSTAAAWLAKQFGSNERVTGGALTKADIARLLARRAKTRHSIYGPTGKPDPALERVLARGRIANNRLVLGFDGKRLPAVSPSMRRELLSALGEEAYRWLDQNRVDTRAYNIGGLSPWFGLPAASRKRAQKLLDALGKRK